MIAELLALGRELLRSVFGWVVARLERSARGRSIDGKRSEQCTYESLGAHETFLAVAFTAERLLRERGRALLLLLDAAGGLLRLVGLQFRLRILPLADAVQRTSVEHAAARETHQPTVVQLTVGMRVDRLLAVHVGLRSLGLSASAARGQRRLLRLLGCHSRCFLHDGGRRFGCCFTT